MKRVGIRELRQNLSVHLRRVKAGERLEVTEHGRPVAVLAPLSESGLTLELWVAAGWARPAQGDLLALGPPPRSIHGASRLSHWLELGRRERL